MEEQGDGPQHSTHATRHPEKPVIPARPNYRKTTRAERETAEVRRALKRERNQAIQKELNDFMRRREEFTLELATKFSIKIEKARALVNSANMKVKRAPNLRNALVSRRAKELNEGRSLYIWKGFDINLLVIGLEKGSRYSMAEIQDMVQQEIEEGLHADLDEDELREELKDSREFKTKGARSTNRAAAVDHRATLRHLEQEMGDLYERCGTMGFAFFTRGHIHDSIIPGWIESQESLRFVQDVLEMTPEELCGKFELWACAKDRSRRSYLYIHAAISPPSQPRKLIARSPFASKKVVGRGNLTMSYEKYESDIVQRYGVDIRRGWPPGIKFRSPHKITRLEEAQSLRTALMAGECKWVKLSKGEKENHAKERQEKIASGEAALKVRKKRSDAGKKRGPRGAGAKRKRGEDDTGDGSDVGGERGTAAPRKKSKGAKSIARQLPPRPKSNEFVSDSDD
ncbi:hypothetical protein H0H92_000721 [Tricholoma furcatifolium]|nr:hypothetical protein H0H92_000721 [Tricholoma furcatifolium]